MATMRRDFTPEQDELIKRQANGDFSLNSLRLGLHTTYAALKRRAKELGVTLNVKTPTRILNENRKPGQDPVVEPEYADRGKYPERIERDELLERLHQYHGDQLKRSASG